MHDRASDRQQVWSARRVVREYVRLSTHLNVPARRLENLRCEVWVMDVRDRRELCDLQRQHRQQWRAHEVQTEEEAEGS